MKKEIPKKIPKSPEIQDFPPIQAPEDDGDEVADNKLEEEKSPSLEEAIGAESYAKVLAEVNHNQVIRSALHFVFKDDLNQLLNYTAAGTKGSGKVPFYQNIRVTLKKKKMWQGTTKFHKGISSVISDTKKKLKKSLSLPDKQ